MVFINFVEIECDVMLSENIQHFNNGSSINKKIVELFLLSFANFKRGRIILTPKAETDNVELRRVTGPRCWSSEKRSDHNTRYSDTVVMYMA